MVLSINTKLNPELREKFLKNEINKYTCPQCGFSNTIDQEILYHDMKNEFVIWYGYKGVSEETIKMREDNYALPEYFKFAGFIARNILEAAIIIKMCEKDGAPKNEIERDKMQKYIEGIILHMDKNNLAL